jgi:hypothetical protein
MTFFISIFTTFLPRERIVRVCRVKSKTSRATSGLALCIKFILFSPCRVPTPQLCTPAVELFPYVVVGLLKADFQWRYVAHLAAKTFPLCLLGPISSEFGNVLAALPFLFSF